MPAVTLTELWLHTAADLSDSITLGQQTWVEQFGVPVQVREYAAGRKRVVSRPGSARSLSVTVPYLSRVTWLALLGRVGPVQMMRDQRGRKWWGVIDGLNGDEFYGQDLVRSVSFTFQAVTWSEVV
jgi:hypothetical protein